MLLNNYKQPTFYKLYYCDYLRNMLSDGANNGL